MEKDIDKITKNPETEIVIRIDDFGGKVGLTIREFVKSERYTGFTKAGTKIPADKFKQFKEAINSIDESELESAADAPDQTKLDEENQATEKTPSETPETSGKKEEGEETPAETVM